MDFNYELIEGGEESYRPDSLLMFLVPSIILGLLRTYGILKSIQITSSILIVLGISFWVFDSNFYGSLLPLNCIDDLTASGRLVPVSKVWNVDEDDQDWRGIYSKYDLYFYHLNTGANLKGTPVVFVPGNRGSHRQVRHIADSLKKSGDYDIFSISNNEELSGIHGSSTNDQSKFIQKCFVLIKKIYKMEKMDFPSKIVWIGHSMGGVVLRSALQTFKILSSHKSLLLLTIASPLTNPIINSDPNLLKVYENVRSTPHQYPIISLVNGVNDTMVPVESMMINGLNERTIFLSSFGVYPNHDNVLNCSRSVELTTEIIKNFDQNKIFLEPQTLSAEKLIKWNFFKSLTFPIMTLNSKNISISKIPISGLRYRLSINKGKSAKVIISTKSGEVQNFDIVKNCIVFPIHSDDDDFVLAATSNQNHVNLTLQIEWLSSFGQLIRKNLNFIFCCLIITTLVFCDSAWLSSPTWYSITLITTSICYILLAERPNNWGQLIAKGVVGTLVSLSWFLLAEILSWAISKIQISSSDMNPNNNKLIFYPMIIFFTFSLFMPYSIVFVSLFLYFFLFILGNSQKLKAKNFLIPFTGLLLLLLIFAAIVHLPIAIPTILMWVNGDYSKDDVRVMGILPAVIFIGNMCSIAKGSINSSRPNSRWMRLIIPSLILTLIRGSTSLYLPYRDIMIILSIIATIINLINSQ